MALWKRRGYVSKTFVSGIWTTVKKIKTKNFKVTENKAVIK